MEVRILCLSGSLRLKSYNSALIEAVAELSSDAITAVIFTEMAALPLFNPDREGENIPSVAHLKKEISLADGVIIASPEYAHGISGVMKNALDWVVSDETFPDMPVALLNCSPRATHAQLALREVLKTMSAKLIDPACVTIPLLSTQYDCQDIIRDEVLSERIRNFLEIFYQAVLGKKKGQM